MKTDFSINVQIGVTPEVVALVQAILGQPVKQADEPVKTNDQGCGQQMPSADMKPTRTARRQKAESTVTQAITPDNGKQQNDQNQAETSEQANGKTQTDVRENKPLTEEDIRAAIHRTRQRIEGEDYKENTSGELYKKYHKALSTQFKQIAAFLGVEKPSLLPADKRQDFIDECEKLDILDDGTIGIAPPF